MAIRIYDQTIGQLAGIVVPTTGLGAITRDGLEAYAQMTVSASGLGLTGDTAGEGNVVSITGATISNGAITLNANAESVVIDTQGFENVALTVSGFGVATIAVQWSNVSTTGFVAGLVMTVGTSTTATTITADGQYTAPSGGRYLRIITTAYTSGTLVVTPTFYAGGGSGGSGGGAVTVNFEAVATASAKTYVEGVSEPVTQSLHGSLYTEIRDSTGANIDWNATSPIAGGTAAGAALANAPVTTGGLARTSDPTAVDNADVVNGLNDALGKRVVIPALRGQLAHQATTITASTTETTIFTAAGAGVFADLYGLVIVNSSATDTEVTIKDATAGTTRMTVGVKAGATAGFTVEAGSALPQASANNNWTATCADSVTSIFVTAMVKKTTA